MYVMLQPNTGYVYTAFIFNLKLKMFLSCIGNCIIIESTFSGKIGTT